MKNNYMTAHIDYTKLFKFQKLTLNSNDISNLCVPHKIRVFDIEIPLWQHFGNIIE